MKAIEIIQSFAGKLILVTIIFFAVFLVFSSTATASVSWDGSKILISDGAENLTTINQVINNVNRLEQISAKEWLLKVPIQVQSSGSFYINDSDTGWLKLLSLNDGDEAYIANYGFLEIKNTKITSWNTIANDFAYMRTPGRTNDTTRAYIYSRGVSSTMNIYNSNLSYLGYNNNVFKQGVEYWQIGNAFEVMNSTFINNHRGLYIVGSASGLIKNNTITNSVDRGIDTHQKNNNPLVIDGNTIDNPVIPTAYEGIVIEGNNSIIKNNYVARVGYNGIHLIGQSYNNIVENNSVYYAYHSGIDIHNYASSNTITNCTVWDAGHDDAQGGDGIFVHNYGVHDNKIINCISYNNRNSGFKILGGYNNSCINCTAHGSPTGIQLYAAEGTFIENSNFYNNTNDISLYNSYWTDVAPYPNKNNVISNSNFSTFYMWNTSQPGDNTISDPIANNFTIILSDTNNMLNIHFTDGKVFSENSVSVPNWYPDGSNISLTTIETTTFIVYNMTARPASGSATVTVNKFDTSLAKGNILVDFTADTTNGNNVDFVIGDLKADTNYQVKRNSLTYHVVKSNANKCIAFSNSEWSAKNFTIEETNAEADIITSPDVNIGQPAVPLLAAPSAPQNLAVSAGNSQVSLFWQVPASDGGSAITGYKIYRGNSSGGETLLASIGTSLSYLDTAVSSGQTYYYQISAINSVGESSRSNEVMATSTAFTGISSKIKVYPNPYIKGKSLTEKITFANLPTEATIKIYTSSGKLVKELTGGSDGKAEWNVNSLGSGVYLYVVSSAEGVKKGKISVIK